MTGATSRRIGRNAATAALLFAADAALGQSADLARVQILTRECEGSRGGDEIVVCGQRGETRSPYRVPEEPDRGFDPEGAAESVSRERNALMEPGSRTGTGSCSNIGPGGFTGCMARHFDRQIDQYGGRPPRMRDGYRRDAR